MKIEQVIDSAEIIRDVTALDCNVIICDANACILHFVPARTFNAECVVGDVASGGLIKECIATRKIIKGVIPASVYGTTLKSILYPILEQDGTLVGIIGTATSMKTQETLQNSAQAITATSQQMTKITEDLAKQSVDLAEKLLSIKTDSENALQEIVKTGDILKFVSDVAANSNLLGLNAAIEAARAGEQGRGFAVVADEIRKMASNSANSVLDIKVILQTIQEKIEVITKKINLVAEFAENQSASTEEISASMQQLLCASVEVEKVAQII